MLTGVVRFGELKMRFLLPALMPTLIVALGSFSVHGQAANTSTYTKFNFKTCKVDRKADPADSEDGGSYLCPGYKTHKVYFASGDLREFVAAGTKPQNHCAGKRTFATFNSTRPTMEWRLDKGRPQALIQRWDVSVLGEDGTKTDPFLVVTKIEAKNSCWMGVVRGNMKDANVRAREIADRAADFKCQTDKFEVVGGADERIPENVPCAALE
jgi:hypothetical protein